MTGKNDVAVVLPSWNPNEPRFIIKKCPQCGSDRKFHDDDKCVYNQRLGFAYSVDEIVDVLNINGESWDKLYDFIRNNYLKFLHDDNTVYSREMLLNSFKQIADEVGIDLKEYPKISLEDLIKKE